MRKNKKLEEVTTEYQEHSFLYIYGMAGVGKTTTIQQLEKQLEEKCEKVIYLDMDKSANQKKVISHIKDKSSTLILDNFHSMKDTEVISDICNAILYDKTMPKVIFVSRMEPPIFLNENIYKGKIKVIDGQWSFFDKKEILDMAQEKCIDITREQTDKICSWSEGHPAVMQIALYIIQQNGYKESLKYIATHPMMTEYIRSNIWEYLSNEEKTICRDMAYYPFIYDDAKDCEDKYWIIENLKKKCVLKCDEKGEYFLPRFLKDFMAENGIVKKEDSDILNTIGEWMQSKGRFKNALECYYKSGNKEKHRECMEGAFDKLFWTIDGAILRTYLEFSMKEVYTKKALFLKGILFINDGEFEQAKEVIEKLGENLSNKKDCRESDYEIYLNLLYYYPEMSICNWMNEAEKLTAGNGKIRIYSLNYASTGCLYGAKDLSELFCHSKKDIDYYQSQWKKIFVKEQWEFFMLAEAEYLLETNRMKEAEEVLIPYLIYEEDMDVNKQEILFGILCNLYIMGHEIKGYENLLQMYYEKLKLSESETVVRNVISQRIIYDIWNKKNSMLYKNFFDNEEEDYEKIERYNCCYLIQKAKNHLFMKRYENAYMLFRRLNTYFGTILQYGLQTECNIGQAVAAWKMNEEAEALKLLTVAMTAAEQYRYVGIFSLYGTPGKNLLDRYCKTLNDWDRAYNRKKSYYYGNVVGVSFENYLKVLIRAVKKNASRYPYNRIEHIVEYETLTVTEVSILQYIEQGCSNSKIAEIMNIKLTTVKTHVYNIYKKLDVKSRVQAVQKGKELGILVK